MNVFITGATGYVGNNLAKKLADKGHIVHALCRNANKDILQHDNIKIFKGDIPANKAVQGPIGIAKFYGGEWIWSRFWLFTALISLGLAFMNILPIPALDGGHVVLLIIEMITGKAISTKAMERVQTVGMVILLSLMVLIFGNDIIGLFRR